VSLNFYILLNLEFLQLSSLILNKVASIRSLLLAVLINPIFLLTIDLIQILWQVILRCFLDFGFIFTILIYSIIPDFIYLILNFLIPIFYYKTLFFLLLRLIPGFTKNLPFKIYF